MTDFRYEGYSISKGKPHLEGLPSSYVECEDEADTLEIVLSDAKSGLKATIDLHRI